MYRIPILTSLTRLLRLATTTSLPVGLFILGMPSLPVTASPRWNQFDVCIAQISGTGVSQDKAAIACSDALIPKELSQCVLMIRRATPIMGEDALRSCYQVRRPVDLGNCVADIYHEIPSLSATETPEEKSANATSPNLLKLLSSCQASLRPGFYSECVTAVNRDVPDITPIQALDTCLSSEEFPRDLFPSYEQ